MTRILTSIVGILIMIPICIFSHTAIWPLVLSAFTLIAVHEILSCIESAKERYLSVPAYLFSFLPILCWLLTVRLGWVENMYQCIFFFAGIYVFAVQVSACLAGNRIPSERVYSSIGLVLYVVICMTAISQIRYLDNGNDEGKYIYLLIFFGGWISDTFAYFTGRFLGKHKLCPSISPKKTIEGSIGGVLANIIVFAGYALVLRSQFEIQANVIFFGILGALFSVVGQFGDLFASCIKRHYGIKDYGKMFPGHGGVLDRFDSTLAIALVMLLLNAAFGSKFLIL